jgi:hypothetical protein
MLRARGLRELAASVLTIPPSSSQPDESLTTNRKHDGEHAGNIERESECCDCGKRRENGDWQGGSRHQHCSPALQEDEDHDQDQDRNFVYGIINFMYRLLYEFADIKRDIRRHPGRKFRCQRIEFCANSPSDLDRIRAWRLMTASAAAGLLSMSKNWP